MDHAHDIGNGNGITSLTGLTRWQRFSLQGGSFGVMCVAFLIVITAGIAIMRTELGAAREDRREENRLFREELKSNRLENVQALREYQSRALDALKSIQDHDTRERGETNRLLLQLVQEIQKWKKDQ